MNNWACHRLRIRSAAVALYAISFAPLRYTKGCRFHRSRRSKPLISPVIH